MPAVTIQTTQPVTLLNSTISSQSHCIATNTNGANLTIHGCTATGLNPGVDGQEVGRFLTAQVISNLVIEHNLITNTAGIYVHQYGGNYTAANTIKIRYNLAHNIDGRLSAGSTGFRTWNIRTSKATGATDQGWNWAQFTQFDRVQNVPNIEISWNQVINDPGNSRPEDNINMYLSSGTAASSILIHDNYIQGAYAISPTTVNGSDANYNYDWSFTGGGIMLGDGTPNNLADSAAYLSAYNNQVVSTQNYGIAINSGHDNSMYNNRVVCCGQLSTGALNNTFGNGYNIWNEYDLASNLFFNDAGQNNTAGWIRLSGRSDWWTPNATSWTGATSLSTVTSSTEAAEFATWKTKVAAASITLGPGSTRQTPVITWATPAPITQGTAPSATQLNATANVPGTFAYIPAAGTVLPTGTSALTASFTPTDTTTYTTATATVNLVVNVPVSKLVPVITWVQPKPIIYGTGLSAQQLNATASYNGAIVPGNFTYTPAVGTVLPHNPPASVLHCTFTPTDATTYTTVTAITTIGVWKRS